MKNVNRIIFTLIISSFLFSCKKDDDKDAVKPKVSSAIGFVTPKDEFGYPEDDKSGFVAELVGTGKSSTTNEAGKFSFDNLTEGYYLLKISKSGYSTYQTQWTISTAGGNEPFQNSQTSLLKVSSTIIANPVVTITNNSLSIYSDSVISVSADVLNATTVSGYSSYNPEQRGIAIYFDTVNTVSNSKYLNYTNVFPSSLSSIKATWSPSINNFKRDYKLKSSSKVYFKIYGISSSQNYNNYNYNDVNGYTDPDTRLYIRTNLAPNPSEVIEVTIP